MDSFFSKFAFLFHPVVITLIVIAVLVLVLAPQRTSICVTQTSEWLKVNRLQLNTAKSEQLWCTSPRQQNRLPNNALHVGCDIVQPVSCVRNLGIFINSDVSMKTRISKTVSSCFAALRRLRSIRRSVSQAVLHSLVTSLIVTAVLSWPVYLVTC